MFHVVKERSPNTVNHSLLLSGIDLEKIYLALLSSQGLGLDLTISGDLFYNLFCFGLVGVQRHSWFGADQFFDHLMSTLMSSAYSEELVVARL